MLRNDYSAADSLTYIKVPNRQIVTESSRSHDASAPVAQVGATAGAEVGRRFADRPMKIVSISTMFPNPVQPIFGVFVHNRLSALSKLAEVRVISPIPYFPILERFIPKYRDRRKVPADCIAGPFPVYYPRYLSIPKFLKPLDGLFLLLRLWPLLRGLQRSGFDFDLIDAHLAFPEGFACRFLGWLLGKKVCVTLRGHDINEITRFPVRRRQVGFAIRNADRVYAVSAALKAGAVALGVDPNKILVSSNGVDSTNFAPRDKSAARRKLGLPLDGKLILSIGYLVPRKGFHHLIEAMNILVNKQNRRDIRLLIVGGRGGEQDAKPHLDKLVTRFHLGDYVVFAGQRPNGELPDWYNAADVFALMSSKEGWPNVILEAMGCGLPVVANAVWGIPEIVCSEDYGMLVQDPPDPERTAEALRIALDKRWNTSIITEFAHSQTWDKVAARLFADMKAL